MKVKICGLKNFEEIDYINEFLPDYAGFIFADFSKRYITPERAFSLKQKLKKNIKSVGVFVDENMDKILEIANTGIIDIIQLHGREDEDFIQFVKRKTQLPVVKAFKPEKNLIDKIKKTKADFILIDSCSNGQFGGTGTVFDWKIIPAEYRERLFLAGGINCNNIKEAIEKVSPYCIDINSGVETNGNKDREKIKKIFEIIKGHKNE